MGGKVEYQLYNNDHDGLYISKSTESREIVEKLLGTISHLLFYKILTMISSFSFRAVPCQEGCTRMVHICQSKSSLIEGIKNGLTTLEKFAVTTILSTIPKRFFLLHHWHL